MELGSGCDVVGGDAIFWWDNWLGDGPLAWKLPTNASDMRIRDFWEQGAWDWERLRDLLPEKVVGQIASQRLGLSEGRDELYWRDSKVGMFSVALVYKRLRGSRVTS